MNLPTDSFQRAREFMKNRARPLERAMFETEFEGGSPARALSELKRFQNEDGGFGNGLEPDLTLPGSSVLATAMGLTLLRELGVLPHDPCVHRAIDWLAEAFDPDLAAWRSVPKQAEDHPHAAHWAWSLHQDGLRWPVGVLPRAEILAHLHRSAEHVPAELLADQTDRLVADLSRADTSLGADALLGCDLFVRTEQAPAEPRKAVASAMKALGEAMVSRDPEAWSSYCAKPLKLAPNPESVLAESLAAEVQRNLDYEISHQDDDGSWSPNWNWNGAYPEAWAIAEREWRGHLTLNTLRSLAAYDRL
ncbi:MAG: hypothetical protein JRG80_21810 [Deltaproteobacteria bacterium]|nr:hypothetical protein [Deltaproteobacteria bacterium]MBW2401855.1 hypothetical protein [Deltaproteobacteria bacterium]